VSSPQRDWWLDRRPAVLPSSLRNKLSSPWSLRFSMFRMPFEGTLGQCETGGLRESANFA
jgi:hypothetical protein